MAIRLNTCIHALNIPGEEGIALPASDIDILKDAGMLDMRVYSDPNAPTKGNLKKYLLIRFDMQDWEDLELIDGVLHDLLAAYCTKPTCPTLNEACAAFRPPI